MRRLVLTAPVVIATLAVPAAGVAQAPTIPEVGVSLSGARSITISGTEGLQGGPVRVVARTAGRRPASFSLIALRPGRTLAQLRRVLRTVRDPRGYLRTVSFRAGGGAAPGGRYVTTLTLAPETTYVVANSTADNPAQFGLRSFTTAAGTNGAEAGEPDTTVDLRDYAFSAIGTLDRGATVRFANRGQQLHIAIASRVLPNVSTARALRVLRRTDTPREFRALGRIFADEGDELLGLVSNGVVNDVESTPRRAGRYVLFCPYADSGSRGRPHHTLGMLRGFRVR